MSEGEKGQSSPTRYNLWCDGRPERGRHNKRQDSAFDLSCLHNTCQRRDRGIDEEKGWGRKVPGPSLCAASPLVQ